MESLEFYKNFDWNLTKYQNNKNLLKKLVAEIYKQHNRGARKQSGHNLKHVWDEFSTIS